MIQLKKKELLEAVEEAIELVYILCSKLPASQRGKKCMNIHRELKKLEERAKMVTSLIEINTIECCLRKNMVKLGDICTNNFFEQNIIEVDEKEHKYEEHKHTESEPSKAIYIIFAIALGATLGILRFIGI